MSRNNIMARILSERVCKDIFVVKNNVPILFCKLIKKIKSGKV